MKIKSQQNIDSLTLNFLLVNYKCKEVLTNRSLWLLLLYNTRNVIFH